MPPSVADFNNVEETRRRLWLDYYNQEDVIPRIEAGAVPPSVADVGAYWSDDEIDLDGSDEDESDKDESDNRIIGFEYYDGSFETGTEDKSDEKSDDEIKHWIYTAQIGDLVGLTRHLEQGIDINSSIKRDGVTDSLSALHWAARNGHLQIVKILVEKGAVVDSATITDRYTPLSLAVPGGHFEVAKFLVEKGAKIDSMCAQGSSLLHGASAGGYLQLAKFLVEKGALIDSVTKQGLTLLHFVASRKNCWERKGAEEENATKRKCSLEVAKFLVEKGADISLVCSKGCSVLSCAAYFGHIELAKWLMEIGAVLDLDDKDKGMLHSVAAMGHLNVVKWLVEQGAKIDTPRVDGRTPFHSAVKGDFTHEDCSSTAVVEWLATCATTTFKILDAFTSNILSEAQGLSPEKKVEVTPIIKRLMTIKAVRTRKLDKARERLVQARGLLITGQERSDHLSEAGKAVSWVLKRLAEDEEASMLDAEIAQEQECASEAAMSALLSECNMEEAGAKCTKKKTKGKTNKKGTAMKALEQPMANEHGQAAKTLAAEERTTETVTEVAVEVADAVAQVGLEAGMDGDHSEWTVEEVVEWTQGQEQPQLYQPKLRRQRAL
jgi:ankyrin repeat protein